MHNWEAERDFFADGSRGQRVYVHPRSRIVIVQLANDSAQEFPFRKIVHHLMGEPFRYPVEHSGASARLPRGGEPAPTRCVASIATSSSVPRPNPADYVISEAGMIAVGQTLLGQPGKSAVGLAVLELAVERSPSSSRARDALAAASKKPR